MDAYVLAPTAAPSVVSQLAARVSPAGPIRVVCPLTGDLDLYVALSGRNARSEGTTIANGLPGADVYVPLPQPVGGIGGSADLYPTHCEVDAFVGFALLDLAGAEPTGLPPVVLGDFVVGVAVFPQEGDRSTRVLIEVTGPDMDDLRAALESLRTSNDFTVVAIGVGDVRPEGGFTLKSDQSGS